MNITTFEKLTENTRSIGVSKYPNRSGNYEVRFFDHKLNRWVILPIKTFQDALTYVFMSGFRKVKEETSNRIIMLRGEYI